MILAGVLERFEKKAPVCVMIRATLENVLAPERLDRIFEENAHKQYVNELLFSTVVDIMGEVVSRIRPSVNAAYRTRQEEMGVTIKSVYDKLKGIEPRVSRALVRDTAAQVQDIMEKMGKLPEPLLKGYRVKILDGNHLRRTDRRIGELRELNAAPLPGKALVVYDPQFHLVIDVVPCEDGHTQERKLLPQLIDTIEAKDVWIGDRNFCTIPFLSAIDSRRAKFIIRQHGNLPYTLRGKRKFLGQIETGLVYEQAIVIPVGKGEEVTYRRITVKLKEPTRDGDTEIHVITNLPKRISGLDIVQLYRGRWTIETAFQEIAKNLEGEIQTLGYPKAALFGFCMALLTYNLFSCVQAAVHAVHGAEAVANLSAYYVALEVHGASEGMTIVLDAKFWRKNYSHLTPLQMARELKRLASLMQLSKYQKAKWKPKKKSTTTMNKKHRGHVSTARVLEESRGKSNATT